MNLYKSKTYIDGLQKASSSVLRIENLKGKSVLITGCTGLILSCAVDLLLALNKEKSLGVKIYAACRDQKKFNERFLEKADDKNLVFIQYDATSVFESDIHFDFIIHGASNASPSKIGAEPLQTFRANVYGTEQMLNLAIKNKCRLLFVSSSEVYGILQNQREPIKENQYGFIDILNPRNSYAESKRAAESLCCAYKSQFGLDFVTVRPGHIYGPAASVTDNRVSSKFMFDAVKRRDLVLKSEGKQIRSYCYVLDCASAILSVLTTGESGETYNISNHNSILSVRKMAGFFAKAGGVKVLFDIPSNAEKQNFNPMINSSLDSRKLEALGWKPVFECEEGFLDSVKIIREAIQNLREMQLLIVKMMKAVDELFRENNIRYFIIGGSVLGAVRHQGFIPWDDDMDIAVMRPDFSRAEELLSSLKEYIYEPTEKHIIPDGPTGHLRFVNENQNIENSPTIDVFALDGVPDNIHQEKIWKRFLITQNFYHLAVLGRPSKNRGLKNKIITWCLLNFIPKCVWKKIKEKTFKRLTSCDVKKSLYISNIFGVAGKKEIFSRGMFDSVTFGEFEGLRLPMPANPHEYLAQLYGDYMTLPPLEKRVPKHRGF